MHASQSCSRVQTQSFYSQLVCQYCPCPALNKAKSPRPLAKGGAPPGIELSALNKRREREVLLASPYGSCCEGQSQGVWDLPPLLPSGHRRAHSKPKNFLAQLSEVKSLFLCVEEQNIQ